VNLVGGEGRVDDYIAKLKAEGYDRAALKTYINIYGLLTWCEKEGDIGEDEQKLVMLSVSPKSTGRWGAYLLLSRMNAGKNRAPTQTITLGADRATNGAGQTYPVIEFGVRR
jgi:hypothetical protein